MKYNNLSWLITHVDHNGKWFRFHQWQPWCNTFYLNNERVVLTPWDKKDCEWKWFSKTPERYAKTFEIFLPRHLFKTVVLRLTEFFKDKNAVYIDIRPPGRMKYDVSPVEDFLAHLFEMRGANIQYAPSLKEQKQGVRLNHLFSAETSGLMVETYLKQWLDNIETMVVGSKVFEPIWEEKGANSIELEIETLTPFFLMFPKRIERELDIRFEKHLADNHYINFKLIERSPATKPYKRKCLCLAVLVAKDTEPKFKEKL